MARHRLLIVEDEQDIAALIKHMLERGGDAEAQIVGSGDLALQAVAERPPDLIILDLNLPVVGGLEVCRILRSRADVPHVPIIMLTARTSEDDRVSGLEHGADDYVTKPFSLRELSARVRASCGAVCPATSRAPGATAARTWSRTSTPLRSRLTGSRSA
jgi:two-component system, OmpR family, phosphate regulon response regulator PhoB